MQRSAVEELSHTAVMKKQLEDHGINTEAFGKGKAKTLAEVSCCLALAHNQLK